MTDLGHHGDKNGGTGTVQSSLTHLWLHPVDKWLGDDVVDDLVLADPLLGQGLGAHTGVRWRARVDVAGDVDGGGAAI